MDEDMVNAWVEGYRRAWQTYEPTDIERLFTEEAVYYRAPYLKPWCGRTAIVAGWLDRKDAPNTWEFRHEVLAISGDLGFVQGLTRYFDPPAEYSNLWVIRLALDGRCSKFTDWWMKHL